MKEYECAYISLGHIFGSRMADLGHVYIYIYISLCVCTCIPISEDVCIYIVICTYVCMQFSAMLASTS